jgi:hypothetical protein
MTIPETMTRIGRIAGSPYGSALVGAVLWGAALILLRPHPFDTAWAKALLMLAPLVLLPLGLRLVGLHSLTGGQDRRRRIAVHLQLPAALLLGWAFLLPQGLPAAALSMPWLAMTGCLALLGLIRIWAHLRQPLRVLCLNAGLIYVAVGAFWAMLDRWGVRPLAFEAVIVLLTAIHFHYAGFALPVLTGLAMPYVEGPGPRLAGIGVVVAVPLVAGGITARQLNRGPLLECAAAWLMASAGVLTGCLYFRLAVQSAWPRWVRGLWALSAVSLTGGMALAALYGSRFYMPLAWLDIPWMRALHGTANALGFAPAGLLAWTLADSRPGMQRATDPTGAAQQH